MNKSRRPKSTREQRRQWLYEHRELKNASHREIVKAMKKAGLLSPSTYFGDVKL